MLKKEGEEGVRRRGMGGEGAEEEEGGEASYTC